MIIAVAQITPIKGAVLRNIELHKKYIRAACEEKSDLIIFPELSITGYEPSLARGLATNSADTRFDDFQNLSDTKNINICLGLPIEENNQIFIGMVIFQPFGKRLTYCKQYLHPGEDETFSSGNQQLFMTIGKDKLAFAICYETSVDEHTELIHRNEANIYIASVLNSYQSIDKDIDRLSKKALKYKMDVVMSNFTGTSGGYECAGKSSVWNTKGDLKGQLSSNLEGLLIYDTQSQEVKEFNY